MNDLKLITALLCDSIIIDQNGKISLLGIFDRIFASDYPAQHPAFVLYTLWEGKAGTYKQKALIKDPDGKPIADTEANFEVKDSRRHQINNNFLNLILPKKGKYKIEILLNNELVNTQGFDVLPPAN